MTAIARGDLAAKSMRIDRRNQMLRRQWARLGAQHVVFTRPDHLHWHAWHGFGDQHGLNGMFCLHTTTIATTQKCDVDLDVFRLKSAHSRHAADHESHGLRRHPQLNLVAIELGRAVHRLHGELRNVLAGVAGFRCLRRFGNLAVGDAAVAASVAHHAHGRGHF